MLEACGLKGHRIGGAQISPKHANFIENAGGARTADAIALMAEARRRAREQFGVELEHEVELLGAIELPPLGRSGGPPAANERRGPPASTRATHGRRVRARRSSRFPAIGCRPLGALARPDPALARSSALASSRSPPALYAVARETSDVRGPRVEVVGAPPPVRAQVARGARAAAGHEPPRARRRRARRGASRRSRRRLRRATTARSRTRCASPSCPSGRSRSSAMAARRGSSRRVGA